MQKLGLALSGGGFRATLYHLGVIRFLKDAGLLEQVTDIASVSGGSILAAHLALNWERYTGEDQRFDEAAAEVVKFVQFDVRNHIVRRLPLQLPLRLLAKLTRRSVRNLTPNAVLERYYRNLLYGDRCIYELPEKPSLHILTTNVSNGGLSVFNRNGLFIQQRSDQGTIRFDRMAGNMASIPRIVGASSAFPGFFPPVEITASDLGVREGQFPTEYFTDGGVYDNLGIRAFTFLKQQGASFDSILVSDAGKPFQILSDTALGLIGQSMRATDILWDRVWQLEKENFTQDDRFIFLPITEAVGITDDPTALHPVIQAEVQSIRTDLDRFSDEEVNALAQHGYEVARKIYRQHAATSDGVPLGPPWAPIPEKRLPGSDVAFSHGASASTTTVVSRQLRLSAVRRVWSSLFDLRDWPTYFYLALALFVFGYLPLQLFQLYRRAQMLATVNDAIAQGDPDIRRVLDLITRDPTRGWAADPIEEVTNQSSVDYSGIEVMMHTRIIDLRHWRPTERSTAEQGKVYIADRVQLRLLDSYAGNRRVTFTIPFVIQDIEFRQPHAANRAVIRRVSEPVEEFGQTQTVYEFEYNLRGLPIGEAVTLETEMLAVVPNPRAHSEFTSKLKTDLISMWLLFPEDHPYRTYSLVQYPADRTKSPAVLDSRYTIDHPYGSLIGWSVVNPQIGTVYECRWKYD